MGHICLVIFAHLQNFNFTFKFLAELKLLRLHPPGLLASESWFHGGCEVWLFSSFRKSLRIISVRNIFPNLSTED